MVFVDGYFTFVMVKQPEYLKTKMLSHIHELMDDEENYRWLAVRAYHAAWLQHLEQAQAMWDEEAIKLKSCSHVALHHTRHQSPHNTLSVSE